jgi:hypothetical protein
LPRLGRLLHACGCSQRHYAIYDKTVWWGLQPIAGTEVSGGCERSLRHVEPSHGVSLLRLFLFVTILLTNERRKGLTQFIKAVR